MQLVPWQDGWADEGCKAATLAPHTHALKAALRAPGDVLPVGCPRPSWRGPGATSEPHTDPCLLNAEPPPGPFLKELQLSQVTASSRVLRWLLGLPLCTLG